MILTINSGMCTVPCYFLCKIDKNSFTHLSRKEFASSRSTKLQNILGVVHELCRLGRGGGGSPRDELLLRRYLIKKTTGGRGSKVADFETT